MCTHIVLHSNIRPYQPCVFRTYCTIFLVALKPKSVTPQPQTSYVFYLSILQYLNVSFTLWRRSVGTNPPQRHPFFVLLYNTYNAYLI